MSDQPAQQSEPKTINVHPQAALGEYAAIKVFYENRVMLLAQEVFKVTSENETLRAEILSIRAALEAELAPKAPEETA
ncbi:hypothetical protein [Phyllobacterium chamaecytisi]|uniref:hypothetical protein n=1 Tax=Phyllobacterium chamaecytisi TaxID=2876082 RepID=UPI001CCA57F2|nr:hypothetical protein [Phyllobacterium sp. KW56]MBZ9600768.1 hypothetical protein [Phyllobacterium sp. KW56]